MEEKAYQNTLFKLKERKNANYYFPFFLAILCFGRILISDNIPGLYMDAVLPDYLAVQVINPSEYSVGWTLPNLGIPLLGNLYHGTVTMICSILSILLSGGTSVLQLRLLNCTYGYAACLLVWMILRKAKVNSWIALAITVTLAISPNLTSCYYTQYYIMLPGVVFLLLAIYMIFKWKEEEKNKLLFLTGVFSGLAFYDYYCFGFYFPGIILALWFISKNKQRNIRRTLSISFAGLVLGCFPYLLGYWMLVLAQYNSISYINKLLLTMLFGVVIFVWVGVFYHWQKADNLAKKETIKSLLVSGVFFSAFILFTIKAIQSSRGLLTQLNVMGSEADLFQRISLLVFYSRTVLEHSGFEYLVMIENQNSLLWIISFSALFMSFILICVEIIRKKCSAISKTILFLILGTLLYYILCIPFATRMQSQHFVVMIFMIYMLFGLSLGGLWNLVKEKKTRSHFKLFISAVISIYMCVCSLLCIIVQNKVSMKMKNDSNIHNIYYTKAINKIAQTAMNNHEKSIDEYYIFPEWGLMAGFDYLTCNTIPFNSEFDKEIMTKLRDKGYKIIVCYFDQKNTDLYKKKLQENLGDDIVFNELVVQEWGSDIYTVFV